MARFKIIHRSIEDLEADHVVELAHAGMSRKCIATEIYGSDRSGQPLRSSMHRVNHILSTWGIRCTDYRNGRNRLGRAMIGAIRREASEADLTTAIRALAKETANAMKKIA